jgi:hypothetical protein
MQPAAPRRPSTGACLSPSVPRAQPAVAPPSTASVAPVTKCASSLSRKATNAATSSGPATRPVGLGAERAARSTSGPTPSSSRYSGVSTLPVTRALMRMPSAAWASAAARVSPTTPCLARDVCRQPANPGHAGDRSVVDHRTPTRGQQRRQLRSKAVEDAGQVEFHLGHPARRVDIRRPAGRHDSTDVVERTVQPSIATNRGLDDRDRARHVGHVGRHEHHLGPCATQPRLHLAAAVLTTRAPSAVRRSAVARPIPRVAPVTIRTLPSSRLTFIVTP